MIHVSFNVTKNDVLAISCHYYGISPTVRRSRLTSQITIALLLTAIGLLVLSGDDRLRPLGVILLVCAGLSAVFFPRWYRSNLRATADKLITESSYRNAFGGYTLALSEEGLASTSPTGRSMHAWEAIDRCYLTPEYLFIFLAGPQGYPIPRAQVPDSTIQEVKAFVESHTRNTEPNAPSPPLTNSSRQR